jgi:hypothetical protein
MRKAAANARQHAGDDGGTNNAATPLVTATIVDSTNLTVMEVEMLDRLLGSELQNLFRIDR